MEQSQYKDDADLAKIYLEKTKDPDLPENYTWDNFFDEVGVPKEARSDFAAAAILKQAKEIEKQENSND